MARALTSDPDVLAIGDDVTVRPVPGRRHRPPAGEHPEARPEQSKQGRLRHRRPAASASGGRRGSGPINSISSCVSRAWSGPGLPSSGGGELADGRFRALPPQSGVVVVAVEAAKRAAGIHGRSPVDQRCRSDRSDPPRRPGRSAARCRRSRVVDVGWTLDTPCDAAYITSSEM